MFKAIVLCSLVAFASAGLLPAYEEQHAPAHYDFSYSVHDGHTGDVKEQQESRRGDSVQGSYSLVEPDGHKRIVHYNADPHTGFNAVVQREGSAHPAPVAHVAHAQPIAVAHHASAYTHAQPIAVAHAQPIAVAHAAPQYALAAPAYSGYSHGHGNAISHQTFSTPVLAQATYAHAAPAQVAYSAPAAYAHAGQAYAHAAPAYAHGPAYGQHGYSTVSQVTHHNAYHH